jgi:RNA polymerase sigma-70 factor, ECF subfamily
MSFLESKLPSSIVDTTHSGSRPSAEIDSVFYNQTLCSIIPTMGDAKDNTTASALIVRSDVNAEALLERASKGDRSAVLALYDLISPTLLAVAIRILGNRAEAEDVIQDVFVRTWRDAVTFDRSRGSATAWLVTLTRNRSIDVVRSRKRRAAHEDNRAPDDAAAMAADTGATPEVVVSDAQRAVAVREALDSLRPEQRQVLELAYFSGLSHSEIAEKLQQPLGTVKTRIAQSVKRLKECLAQFAPAETTVTNPTGDA